MVDCFLPETVKKKELTAEQKIQIRKALNSWTWELVLDFKMQKHYWVVG